VIMGWNRSEFYAIAVGHLADRIAGAGKLQNPPPEDTPALSRNTILDLQEALNQAGFDTGKPDGIMGQNTRSAIRKFQASRGFIADGFPDGQVLKTLNIPIGQ